MSVSVEKKPFGVTKDGEAVSAYCIKNEALAVEIMEYGAAIRSLRGHHGGAWTDAVLGYDTLREYEENDGYLGACIGRVGNRIGGAAFTLNGKDYLHGGVRGFDKYVWSAEMLPDGVRLTRVSPDGEEGYPGTMCAAVSYRLCGDTLTMEYEASADRDTLCNLTNHSYFNLNGSGSVLGHTLQIGAEEFLEARRAGYRRGRYPTAKRRRVRPQLLPDRRNGGGTARRRVRHHHDGTDDTAGRAALHRKFPDRTPRQAGRNICAALRAVPGNAVLSECHGLRWL